MKTYLRIIQDAWLEAGLSGPGPSTVAGLAGIQKRMAGWVSRAWLDIQEYRPDWPWMRREFSFVTSPGKQRYSLVEMNLADLERWDLDAPLIYKVSAGKTHESPIGTTTYDHWHKYLRIGTQPPGQPSRLFVNPANNDLLVYPVPDDEYNISLQYYKAPQVLANDSDKPELPVNRAWQDIIMWRALWYYGYHDGAPDVLAEAEDKYGEKIHALDNRFGQNIYLVGRPLA